MADDSWIAEWTRHWHCRWRVSIINGPTFGDYAKRSDAIESEHAWLAEHFTETLE